MNSDHRIPAQEDNAYSLLKESLDWVGVVNLSPREELLSLDLQRRIARFLAKYREEYGQCIG